MTTKLDEFNKTQLKKDIPDIRSGDIVRVHQKVKEAGGKERIQIFEGLIIAIKHGKGISATFTVRKISGGVGVERIFPLHCLTITKIEVVKRSKVRRAKLYYMRERRGKKAKMKIKELLGVEWREPTEKEEAEEEKPATAKSQKKEEIAKEESK